MSKRVPHLCVDRATIEPVNGGWISYVDPLKYPKSGFGDIKPYYASMSIVTIQGPESGVIELPIDIYWGPERLFDLSQWSSLRSAYRAILEEADIIGLNHYLNDEVYRGMTATRIVYFGWSMLVLPLRLIMCGNHGILCDAVC